MSEQYEFKLARHSGLGWYDVSQLEHTRPTVLEIAMLLVLMAIDWLKGCAE